MVKASSCTGQGHVVDPAIHIINKVKGEDRESPTPWMTYIYILFIIYIFFLMLVLGQKKYCLEISGKTNWNSLEMHVVRIMNHPNALVLGCFGCFGFGIHFHLVLK